MYTYNEDLFLDGTFYIALSNLSYQIFITRIKDDVRNFIFMTSWTFLSGKSKDDYITALRENNNNINRICNKDNLENKNYFHICHSDYEIAILSFCQSIWKNT